MSPPDRTSEPQALSPGGRYLVLITAFLGWMFAGVEMAILIPATRPAIQSFMSARPDAAAELGLAVSADVWLSLLIAAFLLGAAAGGVLFGWLGDRIGRAKSMGLSILCYSAITGLSYFVTSPQQLLALRFVACLGIGGMWPCGVALTTEAWPGTSRAFLAGWIGTSANVGFLILGLLMIRYPITQETWRWVLLLGGAPVLLGVFVLAAVPESPCWVAARAAAPPATPISETFRPPLLSHTLLGIALGTVALLGGWASVQRIVPWVPDSMPQLKAYAQIALAAGAVVGSLAGGWFAASVGTRESYFLMSLASLVLSAWLFRGLAPAGTLEVAPAALLNAYLERSLPLADALFLPVVFALALVSTLYYGWLPYVLPALFPTRVRATGAGVSFNFGRIFSAIAIVSTAPLSRHFEGDVARMAAATSQVFALGLLLAAFVPNHRHLNMNDRP